MIGKLNLTKYCYLVGKLWHSTTPYTQDDEYMADFAERLNDELGTVAVDGQEFGGGEILLNCDIVGFKERLDAHIDAEMKARRLLQVFSPDDNAPQLRWRIYQRSDLEAYFFGFDDFVNDVHEAVRRVTGQLKEELSGLQK